MRIFCVAINYHGFSFWDFYCQTEFQKKIIKSFYSFLKTFSKINKQNEVISVWCDSFRKSLNKPKIWIRFSFFEIVSLEENNICKFFYQKDISKNISIKLVMELNLRKQYNVFFYQIERWFINIDSKFDLKSYVAQKLFKFFLFLLFSNPFSWLLFKKFSYLS